MLSPRMAYVLLWFPLSSETFVFREIQQLVQRGMDIRVYTMYGEKLRGCSDEMKNYAGPIKRFGSVATLRLLKATDFANVPCDVAAMGTRVTVESAKEGAITYTILGELDRDEALNIISCRSRLAIALLGQKVGATVELPAEKGTLVATLTAIEPLDDAVRAWLAQIPTAYEPNA